MVGCGGNIQGMQGTDAGAGTVTNQHCQCTTHAPRLWSGHAAMACVWAWAGWSGRPVVRPGRVQRIMCSQGGGGTPGGRPGFATPLCREGGKRRISQSVGCAGYAEGTEEMVGGPVQWGVHLHVHGTLVHSYAAWCIRGVASVLQMQCVFPVGCTCVVPVSKRIETACPPCSSKLPVGGKHRCTPALGVGMGAHAQLPACVTAVSVRPHLWGMWQVRALHVGGLQWGFMEEGPQLQVSQGCVYGMI
jgi:hypothetical protein